MSNPSRQSHSVLLSEITELRSKIAEYEQLIDSVKRGEVDAMVLADGDKQRLVAFEQQDNVYRQLVENMPEGALILSDNGIVLYANHYMTKILQASLEHIIGSKIDDWLPVAEKEPIKGNIQELLTSRERNTIRGEHSLHNGSQQTVAVYIAMNAATNVHGQDTIDMVITDLTEQKRNEAIAADEQLARAILEQASEAIVVCDQNGTIIRASAAAHQLCGKNPVGHNFEQCLTLADTEGRSRSVTDILASGGHSELIFNTPQKQHCFHVSAGQLLRPDADNKVLGSVISLTDITHIKQTEQTAINAQQELEKQLEIARRSRKALLSVVEDVKASDNRLKKIASRLPGMIYQYQRYPDGRHTIPYASDAVMEIFGMSIEKAQQDANNIFEKIHPDDLDEVNKLIELSTRNLTPWRQEFRIKRDDGTVRWLFADSIPQQQNDGSVLWHGFVTDVTARKSTEEKVELAAKVFENSREGIMITNASNEIVMVNKAFTTITGYSEQDALGSNPKILSSGRQDEAFYKDMWQTLSSQGYWEGELWNQRKDGTVYPEWISISTTYDANDNNTGYIGIFEDITQRKEYEQHIQWLAHFDSLTELPNRTLLRDRTEHAISLAQRNNRKLAMLYCDLDRFKNINDALGHTIGDALLTEIAKRLLSATRREDTVSRQGGDEFIILLPDSDADGAAHVAEKIKAAVNEPYNISGYEMTISPSIGIAVFPDDGDDIDTLAKNADIAMYRAKHLGRNSYSFYTPELQRSSARALKLEKDIHKAIDKDELVLYYQPQVSLSDGSVSGIEALLRWNHSELGMISPLEFIPIAENSGQILRIGEWVTRTAVQQLQSWITGGIDPVRVSVNLSVRELRQPQLFEKLKTIIDDAGLDPNLLELEITESMLMEEQEKVIAALNEINALGVRLSIDDFGTGYSSLSYLKRLPVDQLKIDKSFVQDMLSDTDNAIIVRSIITLGHNLGLHVIAEGVEENTQLDFLRMHYCDYMQGYLFSRPLSTDQITQLLSSRESMKLSKNTLNQADEGTLLIVDDEPGVLRSIKRVFDSSNYNILTAESGQQGLELLAKNEVSVIMADQLMPNMSGVEFLKKARELQPEAIRILLSGYNEPEKVSAAINRGDIYKFLTKPCQNELLRANINEAIQRYNTAVENKRLAYELKEANKELSRLNAKK